MRIRLSPLDILFSHLVRLKAEGICEYCGKQTRLECSHFHGRRKQSVRYDEDNACALCFSCHQFLGENPYVHTEFFKKRLGSKKFELLNIRAQKIEKVSKEALAIYLKSKIKELEQ